MLVYVLTLFCILFFGFVYSKQNNKSTKNMILFIIGLVLICVAGFRYQVGTDYKQYVRNYDDYLDSDWDFGKIGLVLVAKISALIYNDSSTWFFLMSLITVGLVIYAIGKHSTTVELSIIMYILLCCWHTSFNIVKQCAAVSILFCGYAFLKNRNFIKWCFVCLLAALFHVTALLMIPLYFLATNKISKTTICIMLAVGVVCYFTYDKLFELVGFLKQGEGVMDFESMDSTSSVNVLRVLMSCVPIGLFVLNYKSYNKNDEYFATAFNLSFFNMVTNICSMQSIYMSRFCIYTNIFNVLFIPLLVQPLKKERKIFWCSLLFITYFIFWFYDLYKGSTTVNYQWIFNR